MEFKVDEHGYFGEYGGAFVPEMLMPNITELQENYLKIIDSEEFQAEFNKLMADYVGRPAPLYFAQRLSSKYNANIYLKREDLNHTGSHKINNTIGQILIAKKLGKKRIIAETGAGQHGIATATVCALMGMPAVIYMGEIDIERQKANVNKMRFLGSTVVSVTSGSRTLKDATNEAMRDWINNPYDTHYIIGSAVGPHPYPDMVSRLQSIISRELKSQLFAKIGRQEPDIIIACLGGGSNAIGSFYHYIENLKVRLIGAEAAGKGVSSGSSAATLSLGRDGILHGSKTKLLQTVGGQVMEAHSISAGLDYPGIGPQHAQLFSCGRLDVVAVSDTEALLAVKILALLEGIIPALESAHAFAVLEKLDSTEIVGKDIVINLSGSGEKDMQTYLNSELLK
jgi:tryptophan synthase beta chain